MERHLPSPRELGTMVDGLLQIFPDPVGQRSLPQRMRMTSWLWCCPAISIRQ